MTYTQQGDKVTLDMTKEEFSSIVRGLGIASGAALGGRDAPLFYSLMRLTNELNNGNREWTPFEIPAEYAGD